MDQEVILTNVPTEIIVNILSRLPIRTIVRCKCVCKSWFKLLGTPEFINFHLSKSVPGLIVHQYIRLSELLKIFEFEQREPHHIPVIEFDCRAFITSNDASICIEGSANGLLFLRDMHARPNALYICNPITREYINLPNPEGIFHSPRATYGFGLSKMTGQYKVVGNFDKCQRDQPTGTLVNTKNSECHVYTIGTGSWRSVTHDSSHIYSCRSYGAFLKGNLHWLVSDLNESMSLSCFDLETEQFKPFPPPPNLRGCTKFFGDVVVLGDDLCLYNNTSDDVFVIWIMKEYGVGQSWTKEVVISKLLDRGKSYDCVYPIEVIEDGDIIMLWVDFQILYYSKMTKTILTDMIKLPISSCIQARFHFSSFVSLKRSEMENVLKY